MQENPIVKFVADFIVRMFSGKPKFFANIQLVSVIVGGISSVIVYLQSQPGLNLPSWVSAVGSVNVIIAAVVALVMAQLPKHTE
jgi:hypothetical protein